MVYKIYFQIYIRHRVNINKISIFIFIAVCIFCSYIYIKNTSRSSLPSRKKANIIHFINKENEYDKIPALFVKSDGSLEIYNDAGNVEKVLRHRVETRKWYWVEISQTYKKGQEKVGSNQILIFLTDSLCAKDAEFEIKISDGISWEEIKYFKYEVNNPKTIEDIDIWAGKGSIHQMEAYYRYLLWSNTMNLLLVKPNKECITIKEWGPIFRVKFGLYVASLPAENNKVGSKVRTLP